jgi:apolipoprotein N-acyltransferase
VVQAALAGISGVLAPDGAITHTTHLFTSDAFVVRVSVRRAPSLYARTGDLFGSMWAGLAGAVALWTLGRRRRVGSEA